MFFKRFKIYWAKKILNKYAPKGEYIVYINKNEEKILKSLGGANKPINPTGIKSFFLDKVWNAATSVVAPVVKFVAPYVKFLQKYSGWISAISIGIQVIGWLKGPETPDTPNMDNMPEQVAKGVLVNKTSSNAPLPVIYGQRKVGGVGVFMETSGADNEFLYMIFALCEGGVESCEQIYIDDKLVTWSGALTHGTERTVHSGDSNFFKDS